MTLDGVIISHLVEEEDKDQNLLELLKAMYELMLILNK